MKRLFTLKVVVLLFIGGMFFLTTAFAQLPSKVLVGYHENWKTLKISEAHANYNVICLAFALPVNYPNLGYDLRYALPPGYANAAALIADIDLVHSQGKVVLLSIGGATGPIMLNSAAEQTTFVNSINTIFATYGNRIDGIDLDLEKNVGNGASSMAFGAWTMSAPAAGQTRMVNAIKSVMATYLATNGKKMILTAAPEVVYLMGGLSTWQADNVNGGAFLPILDGLRNEIDLVHMQLYNAGGASGGVYAWDGIIYYDANVANGGMNFPLAMNESLVKGFTCVGGRGTFVGIPESKIAFGLPATSAASTAGTGYLTPTQICNAAKYFKGEIAKPAGVTYTMNASRPGLKGLMTWSINEDNSSVNGQWNFAINYTCAFPAASLPVDLVSFTGSAIESQGALLKWATASENNNSYFEILRSSDRENFISVGIVHGAGNTSSLSNYSFTDEDLSGGTYYYKLKQVDIDGKKSMSETIAIHFENDLNSYIIPSLVERGQTLKVTHPSDTEFKSVVMTDLSGKIITELSSVNRSVTNIETTGLSIGVYVVRVYSGEEVIINKVMVY